MDDRLSAEPRPAAVGAFIVISAPAASPLPLAAMRASGFPSGRSPPVATAKPPATTASRVTPATTMRRWRRVWGAGGAASGSITVSSSSGVALFDASLGDRVPTLRRKASRIVAEIRPSLGARAQPVALRRH